MKDIYEAVSKDGLNGALLVLCLVLSYRIWKMKSASELESNCCDGFHFKSQTSNEGGHINITDEHIEHTTENNNDNTNNV